MNKYTGLLASSTIFFISSLVNFFARFLTSIIIARALGAEGKGLYVLTLTTGALLVLLLDIGISVSVVYLTANRRYQTGEIFIYTSWISLSLGLLGGSLFFLLYTNYLANTIFSGVDPSYMLIMLIFLPIHLLTSVQASILLGLQRVFAYNLVGITRSISILALQIGSVILHEGVLGAILAWCLGNLLAFLLTLWLLRKDINFRFTHQRSIVKDSLSYGVKGYLANLIAFFNLRLDSFILNYYSTPMFVGLYSTGVSSAELIWNVPDSISSALFPKSAASDRLNSSRLTAQACRNTLFLMIVLSITFGLTGIWLIPWVFGSEFQASVIPFLLLLPGIVAITITKLINANLSGIGLPQYAAYTSAIVLAATITLDIVLIPPYRIAGAAIASSISYLLSAVLSLYWFRKETQIGWKETIVPKGQDFIYLGRRAYQLLCEFSSTYLTR